MRAEQTLENYTFENTAFHLLQQRFVQCFRLGPLCLTILRFPRYTPATLTTWYWSPHPVRTARTMKHIAAKTTMVLQMLDASDTITKTA
jgi:DNA polymerase zeta